MDVEVLIVGGGPVGLTARALLERWGVRTLLVERHRELSPFPRSRLVNTRSMEIFRQLGIAGKIASRAFPPEFGRVRFRDTLLGADFASAAMIGIDAPIPESPVLGVVTSQDRLEPTLLGAADTPIRYGTELTGLTEADGHVVARLSDGTTVEARYVLAADGANSTARRLLDIGTTGPGALLRVTTVVFDADLRRWSAEQPAGVYFTANGSFGPLYPERGWAWFGPTPDDAEHADWPKLVRDALGDVEVTVERVQHWVVNAFIAKRFRHGRILLAGDAAHALPPAGGLGMNAGVADVHNLCWKLAGVLRDWAGPGLVDTYETERMPVAQRTLEQAVANSVLMHQVQGKRLEQLRNGQGAQAPVELPWSERYFAQLGLVLGVAYGTDPQPSGTEYVPSTEPGHRMPHHWLGEDRSTLDAVGEWFTLFTPDPAGWDETSFPVRVESVPDGPTLLVRPDGHIGARWDDRPGDAAVRHALAAITGAADPSRSETASAQPK